MGQEDKRERFELNGVSLRKSDEWEKDLFGFYPHNIGDTISDMMYTACTDKAFVRYIPICEELLSKGKRWPSLFNNDRIAKTKIRYGWSKSVHWVRMLPVIRKSNEERAARLKKIKPRLYRTQHGMTRDPHTYFLAAVVLNGYKPWLWFEDVRKLPLLQRRWGLTQWERYLITGKKKHLKRYEFSSLLTIWMPRRVYAWDLTEIRAKAAGSSKILNAIEKYKQLPNKG